MIAGRDTKHVFSSVEILDIEDDMKHVGSVKLLQPRHNHAVAVVDDNICVVGGFDGENCLSSCEVCYLPPSWVTPT